MNGLFGNKLKELRRLRGITQDDLAEQLNAKYGTKINKSMISKWENNIVLPYMEFVRYIALYFDVNLDYLMGLESNEHNSCNSSFIHSNDVKSLIDIYEKCSADGQKRILAYSKKILELEKEEKAVENPQPGTLNLPTSHAEATAIAFELRTKMEVTPKANKA